VCIYELCNDGRESRCIVCDVISSVDGKMLTFISEGEKGEE